MIIAGIDYSITSPSICILDTVTREIKFYSLTSSNKALKNNTAQNIFLTRYPDWDTDTERYDAISGWAISVLNEMKPEAIAIEGYSMGSRTGLICNLAENCGLLKYKMYKAGFQFVNFAPTQIKKIFTGKGNAKKEEVVSAVEKELDINFATLLGVKEMAKPIDDIADSYAIVTTLEKNLT